jgi:FSR family fosmidomycin resistance protein-like MFS transporter
MGLTTFLPLFMSDVRGSSFGLAAISLTVLEAAGVAGALLTGTLSDRFGRIQVLAVVLLVAPVLGLAFVVSPNWLSVPLLILLGLTAISPTPVLLALVQDSFPDNGAFANGIYLALNFSVRAAAAPLLGVLADQIGLETTFIVASLAAFLSLPSLWWLNQANNLPTT